MENLLGSYCLSIIVNISSFSLLNTNVNNTLRYFRKQTLNKELKLIGGVMKLFTKKLLGHEISSCMVLWTMKCFFHKFIKPCGSLSYIPNVQSLMKRCCWVLLKRMHILQLVKIYLLSTFQAPLTSASWKLLLTKNMTDMWYGVTTTAYSQRINFQLANVLLFMALLIILMLILVVLNYL